MTGRTTKAEPKTALDNLPAPPILRLSGDFISRVTIIPTTTSSILLGTAIVDATEQTVLIPYIETKVAGIKQGEIDEDRIENEQFDTILSETLPLENALFYAWDFVRDVHLACSSLIGVSGGALQIEPVRLEHAACFAEELQKQAELCAASLRSLIAGAQRGGLAPE